MSVFAYQVETRLHAAGGREIWSRSFKVGDTTRHCSSFCSQWAASSRMSSLFTLGANSWMDEAPALAVHLRCRARYHSCAFIGLIGLGEAKYAASRQGAC